jgi:hypothetical protein
MKETGMFGKRISEYLRFPRVFLVATAAVGLARLLLSLLGLPNPTVAWLSMNVVVLAGALYYGVALKTGGFGSYKQLLPLVFFQVATMHAVAVLGILLSIAGLPNIFASPEYSGPTPAPNQWIHILAHLTIGMIVPTLLLWGLASLVQWITSRVTRRPAVA